MNRPVRWGIIGTGSIARVFAHALNQTDSGQLTAVGSRTQASARQLLDEHNAGRGAAHGSYDALIADPDVQAVYIATPHPLHAQWAIRAAQAGKAVLCEKPAAVNHPQTMAMIHAAAEHGTFFMEAFMYRCHPQTARLVELIQSGAIGQVHLVQAALGFVAGDDPNARIYDNDLAGGGILDMGCYPVSLARLVAGAATGQPFADPVEVAGQGILASTGVDARAVATLKFAGGMLAELATSITTSLSYQARIFGSHGRIELPDPWTLNRKTGGCFELHVHRNGQDPEIIRIQTDRTAFAIQADTVAGALAQGKQQATGPAMSWADTLGNMRTLDRWRAAIGLTYEQEQPHRLTTCVHGRPLTKKTDAPMQFGRIPGLAKPVSRLVMGCDNQPTHAHAAVMFDTYFEYGGNTFDTAYLYGQGRFERLLGWWMQSRGVREQVVIIGKGGHTPHCHPEAITRQLHESLDRLGVDHVDIYMLHRDNPDVPVGEFVDVLNEHQAAGRIGLFGGSNWSIQRFDQANAYAHSHGRQPMTVLSNNFSLARMVDPVWAGCISSSDANARGWHERTQTPNFAWSSQARGFFTPRADLPASAQPDADLVRCWYSEDNLERRRRAIELACQYGVLPINIAAAYVLCQSFPSFALFGPRDLEEMRTSLPALNIQLSPEQLRWLNLDSPAP